VCISGDYQITNGECVLLYCECQALSINMAVKGQAARTVMARTQPESVSRWH